MTENNKSRVARRQKQAKPKQKSIAKRVFLIIGIIFLAMFIAGISLFIYYISTAPELDPEKLSDPFSSQIYDKDGELFAELGNVKRTKVEFDDLPPVLIDAVTATEDARFFDHFGIDLRRIGGAIIANIKRGFGAEGASTITQQVVENAFLTPEKSLKIKVQEQWLALKLEREYSKEQIMEMYLNKIFFGNGAYGVAKAAEVYFGKKDLHDLTLVEAAILAGLPQRPSAYNPFENPDLMAKRVDTVLDLMVHHGKISEEEAEEARQVDIASLLTDEKPATAPHDAFLRKVREEVEEKLGGADIYTDGLKIYTTMDRDAQEYVEFLLTDSEDNPIDYGDDEELQAGLVVLDTKTGAIQAIGGSRNRENIDGYNYAIQGGRQAGSTAKPIVAFGPAIEYNKISTYHQLEDDQPYQIPGTDHQVRNWDRQYRGWVSARMALARSLNVPTIKAFLEVDNELVKEFGEKLGIEFAQDYVPVTEAIGGAETNVTPLQLAGAYRAFGNGGIYNEPYAVTKVEFPDGKVVELKPTPEPVMADYTAYMVTDMLKSVLTESYATGGRANIPGLPVAGKTGTTNLPNDQGVNNAWFAGYTTNYTIAVWTGYKEHNKAMSITTVSQQLFKHTMIELSKDIETPDFEMPDSVVEVEVEVGSNPPKLPSKYTPSDKIVRELFVKGYEPKETSDVYDQLDPVDQLAATYDEETNTIHVSWEYESDHDVSFEVSAKINDGQMQKLADVTELSLDITEVEPGAEYEIQVVVISNEGLGNSDPRTTTIIIPELEEEEEEEPEEEEQNIPPVSDLSAVYNEESQIIDVNWQYNGPPAAFKVIVNYRQEHTVQSQGIVIEGALPGETYTITVVPIGTNGANEGVEGEARSTTIEIPAEANDEEPVDEQPNENNNDQEEEEV
mgnify:FL=1